MRPSPEFHAAILTILTCVFGGLFVAGPFVGTTTLLVLFGLPILLLLVRRLYRISEGRFAHHVLAVQIFVFATIVTSAILAPVKHRDTVRDRQVLLPKTELTCFELSHLSYDRLPIRTRWASDDLTEDSVLTFSKPAMSLGEFIDEVEAQTGTRHSYDLGCGNAASILYGGGYVGLYFK